MKNFVRPAAPRTAELRQRYALAGHEHMQSPGGVLPGAGGPAARTHDALPPDASALPGVRGLIQESWQRSIRHQANPDNPEAPLALDGDQLDEYRRQHPLAAIMPVIQRLLVQPSHDTGLLVAVGDELGRLLWVEGDAALLRRAESMMFVAGADWSEATVGTSAPGTALAVGRSLQISGAEHYKRSVHPWSCTAVPFRDPDSGAVLGVVDITGTETAVAPHALSLVEAAVAAAQAQLRVERLEGAMPTPGRTGLRSRTSGSAGRSAKESSQRRLYRNTVQLLGRDQALLSIEGRTVALSARHSEILALLVSHPEGLNAEELGAMLYTGPGTAVTLRAEMVRLRKVLQELHPAAVPGSRPYRLPLALAADSAQVLQCLQRGAHRMALEIYRGAVLPRSEAPGIVRLRARVSSLLREAVLADGSAESLLQYADLPEARDDAGVRLAALKLLPPRSPKRAAIVADLERLEAEFGR